jgi:hypothetical protein
MSKRSKQNYAEFRHADYCHSFAEWLGIEVPEVEYRLSHGTRLYRMVSKKNKYVGCYWDLPWFKTKKEAKEDYKRRLNLAVVAGMEK